MSSHLTRLFLEETPSTMDAAREVVRAGRTEITRVITGHQSHGRGRRGSPWVDEPGNALLGTWILTGADCELSEIRWLSFVAAIALAETLESVYHLSVRLKWPNDLYCNQRKVAGILIEAAQWPSGQRAALLGMGVNTNSTTFRGDLAYRATSIRAITGAEVDHQELEALLTAQIESARCRFAADRPGLISAWRQRDDTSGRGYHIETEGGMVGVAVGISEHGCLVARMPDGRRIETEAATSV